MLRNRMIFALIYSDGVFTQSRNFRLQRVGDVNWLEKNYNFQTISFSLDELVILDATKKEKDIQHFSQIVKRVKSSVFIPVAVGGGIKRMEDAEILFENGADKIVLNSSLATNPRLIDDIVSRYGSQSVVASIDYRVENYEVIPYLENGTKPLRKSISDYISYLLDLNIGEILLNSIEKDGTGFGYDVENIKHIAPLVNIPLIIMGGAGNEKHLLEGLSLTGVSAVATANLFNFIGDGLPNARKFLLANGANLARWFDVRK